MANKHSEDALRSEQALRRGWAACHELLYEVPTLNRAEARLRTIARQGPTICMVLPRDEARALLNELARLRKGSGTSADTVRAQAAHVDRAAAPTSPEAFDG